MKPISLLQILAFLTLTVSLGFSPAAAEDSLDELRHTFTVGGKPIPPEVFADFGDAWLSDGRPVVTAIDARTAISSNRYFGEITKHGDWLEQQMAGPSGINGPPTISYQYRGPTVNGLLVALAAYSGGGTGVFHYLHLLDPVRTQGIDWDGSTYERLDLKLVRTYSLGDRWQGDITIKDNNIRIDAGAGHAPTTIEARRP